MGRKAVIEDSATIIFRVEHKTREKLEKLAEREEVSLSKYVRQVLTDYAKTKRVK